MANKILEEMLKKASIALDEFRPYTQAQVDECVKAVCLAFKMHAKELAELAVRETGLGDVESKIEKNTGSPDGIWYDLKGKKSVGIIKEDPEQKLKYVAHPKGILASVAPTTNPNVTVIFNAAYALKGRNVLIIAPHPRAKESTLRTCEILNDALEQIGAPKNLIQCIEEPSIELTQELMNSVNVTIATGGAGMVKSAYSSGHPAFGVGPGNVQTIFDRGYSDYRKAIAQTVLGRKYDNGLICACNQSFIIPQEMEEELSRIMKEEKAVYINDEKTVSQFRKIIFPDGGHINPHVVGKNIQEIARMADVAIPEDAVIAVLKIDKKNSGSKDPLCGEKMCPVAICMTYDSFEEAVDLARNNLLYQGAGHSAVIHTDDEKKAEYCGIELPVSRMIVNQPGIFAANPALANGFRPTSTLGCGSWGNNSISENLNFEHLINISRIGWMKDESEIPTSEQIWGS
ncbi:MAG: aldehyde dehydrogenase family protein [Anaerovoracaceae bacterium]